MVYGRHRGRPLKPSQKKLLAERLPSLRVRLPEAEGGLDPCPLFGPGTKEVWLEIGFGTGEHLVRQAAAHPEHGIIGCEPFVNGVAKLLRAIEALGLGNVRIFPDDARLLLAALAPASIGRAFALFPDPWPKARHRKRRIVSAQTVPDLARVLKDGAELRFASDDADYCRAVLALLWRGADFDWTAERAADWRTRPADWPETRYEAKARAAGRAPAYLSFRRHPRRAAKSS